ncbi:FAD dependent oxidoreductase [compost metagenome]
MILPKGVNNLFVIGRCASMTHTAQSAARVTGACFVMGEAAGTAAAICAHDDLSTRQLDVPKLQSILKENGAYLG